VLQDVNPPHSAQCSETLKPVKPPFLPPPSFALDGEQSPRYSPHWRNYNDHTMVTANVLIINFITMIVSIIIVVFVIIIIIVVVVVIIVMIIIIAVIIITTIIIIVVVVIIIIGMIIIIAVIIIIIIILLLLLLLLLLIIIIIIDIIIDIIIIIIIVIIIVNIITMFLRAVDGGCSLLHIITSCHYCETHLHALYHNYSMIK
jgi:hypothetical protein